MSVNTISLIMGYICTMQAYMVSIHRWHKLVYRLPIIVHLYQNLIMQRCRPIGQTSYQKYIYLVLIYIRLPWWGRQCIFSYIPRMNMLLCFHHYSGHFLDSIADFEIDCNYQLPQNQMAVFDSTHKLSTFGCMVCTILCFKISTN